MVVSTCPYRVELSAHSVASESALLLWVPAVAYSIMLCG